ncbi:MAG TPA: hypothetical protein VLK29_03940 [Luteimonas sp.]|nr:hypothetical protein [Luteimonas sp.]
MKTQTWLACALLAALPAAGLHAQDAPKKLYCWTEGGTRVCGDTLPASAIDHARTEINAASGLQTGQVPRALNRDERLAAADEAKRAAEAAEVEATSKRRDLAMVESYNTEDDLRRAYGERITLVEESLKTSRLGVANLRQSLLSLLQKAAELELQSQPVTKPLADGIVNQHADLIRQQAIMQKQLQDRASLGSDLEQALARYRGMKSVAID